MTTTTTASPAERKVLSDLFDLFEQAKGDSSALAEVRRQISEQIDLVVSQLAGHGVDTDALLDELGL